MSGLADALADYLVVRRAMGCKLTAAEGLLQQFVAYCDARGVAVITSDAAIAWAKLPAGSPVWWYVRLSSVRPFARWLQALEPATEVPAVDSFGRVPGKHAVPYVYSEEEVLALMQAAKRLQRPLLRITYATLIGLLATTGMRISEAIHVSCDDIDWTTGALRVLNSKFGKSRLLPLHPSTMSALDTYAQERNRLCPVPLEPNFFITTSRRQLCKPAVTYTFHNLLRWAGLPTGPSGRRPRVHDLRHTFALRTLAEWHAARVDVEARLPLLSAYLGHAKPQDTYWYLSGNADVLAAAAARLSDHCGPGSA